MSYFQIDLPKENVKDMLLAMDEAALRELVRHLTDAGYLKKLKALAVSQKTEKELK